MAIEGTTDDIINAVIEAMIDEETGLKEIVNNGLISSDPWFLKSAERGPLQDDPTRRAFYLCISPEFSDDAQDFYRMPVNSIRRGKLGMGSEVPELEVGGGMKFINFMIMEGWTPKANSREAAYVNGHQALSRIELSLLTMARNQFFAGITTDDGRESTADIVQVFGYDGGRATVIGGDREWYGRFRLRFHFYSELHNEWFQGEY